MRVAITIGHAGRASKPTDRGCVSPDDDVSEVSIVRAYVDAFDRRLTAAGHSVFVLSDGEYREQAARANGYGVDVYINAHVNAGGGDRGEVFHDYRSARGKALAEVIAGRLSGRLGWPAFAKPCRPDTNGTPRDSDYSEAFACIAHAQAPAICFEPYFIDGPRRGLFRSNIEAVGLALAEAVIEWGAK